MSSPLYITGTTPEGVPLFGGFYRMKDEMGFPTEMAHQMIREKGASVDWAEYLADAGSQKGWKFDDAMREVEESLSKEEAQEILQRFKLWGASLAQEGDDFPKVCQRMMEAKESDTRHIRL